MKKLIIKYSVVFGIISLLIFLYWPALRGTAIWDDNSFLFQSKFTQPHFSYFKIWTDFNWPVSVSLHKFILSNWGKHYFIFHIINFGLHLINSFLLFNLLNRMKLTYAKWLTLLFLFHPANVISVAWIIQFKTLLCFFFALLSLHFFISQKNIFSLYALSIFTFILSLLSKSASICLPLVMLIFIIKDGNYKKTIKVLPFLLISFIATIRLLNSNITIESTNSLKNEQAISNRQQVEKKSITIPVQDKVMAQNSQKNDLKKKWDYFIGTTHYYFWQVFIPHQNSPIKENTVPPQTNLYFLHLFLLILLFYIFWKKSALYFLIAGYCMLLPFSGIVLAPFMNMTWVSDQHLYLAIPFFLAFFFDFSHHIKPKIPMFFSIIILPYFVFKVYEAIPSYKNEIEFYKSSIDYDPLNLPVGYNLAMSYLKNSDLNSAVNIVEHFIHMSEVVPELKKNRYYSEMFLLYLRLKPNEENFK